MKLIYLFLLIPLLLYSQGTLIYSENFNDGDLDAPTFGSFYGTGVVLGNWINSVEGVDHSFDSTGYTGYCMSSVGKLDKDPHIVWTMDSGDWTTDEFYVSYWVRFPYAVMTSYPNLKLFYPHWNGTASYVHLAMGQADGSSHYYSAHGSAGQVLEQSAYIQTPNLCDGQWHRCEAWVKFSTSQFRFWYDGILRKDANYADGVWTNAIYYLTLGFKEDAGGGDLFTRQLDDVEIWDGMPGDYPDDTFAPTASGDLSRPSNYQLRIQVSSISSDVDTVKILYPDSSTVFKTQYDNTAIDTTWTVGTGFNEWKYLYFYGVDDSANVTHPSALLDSIYFQEPTPPDKTKMLDVRASLR